MSTVATANWRRRFWTALAVCFFLLPAFLGFGNKFLELLAVASDADGIFAVMPILNYLLASTGFFLLLIWATMHGMFRDIEKPKQDMLERERQLDALEASAAEEELVGTGELDWRGHAQD